MRKRITALALFFALLPVLTGCGKSEAVKETERLIDVIGTVTVDSAAAVEAAEAAYNALSDEERGRVSNAAALTAARKSLDDALLDAQRLSLTGVWETQVSVRDELVTEMDAQFSGAAMSFGDYLDDCVLTLRLELGEDGIYRLSFDPASLEESRQTIRESAADYVTDYLLSYIAAALEESGVKGDFSSREGIEAAMGIKLEDLIQESFEMELEEYIGQVADELNPEKLRSDLQGEGSFLLRPNGGNPSDQADYTLYFSDATNKAPDDGTGAAYSLAGNVLTVDVPEESGFPLSGAWTFTRVG